MGVGRTRKGKRVSLIKIHHMHAWKFTMTPHSIQLICANKKAVFLPLLNKEGREGRKKEGNRKERK
jgi:hypothetical protein